MPLACVLSATRFTSLEPNWNVPSLSVVRKLVPAKLAS